MALSEPIPSDQWNLESYRWNPYSMEFENSSKEATTEVSDSHTAGQSTPPPTQQRPSKHHRTKQNPKCQVEGCGADLSGLKEYHQRYKICEQHLKVESITLNNVEVRFCQQCGRFQPLHEFDSEKRSCRERLHKHNQRRRKRNKHIHDRSHPTPKIQKEETLLFPTQTQTNYQYYPLSRETSHASDLWPQQNEPHQNIPDLLANEQSPDTHTDSLRRISDVGTLARGPLSSNYPGNTSPNSSIAKLVNAQYGGQDVMVTAPPGGDNYFIAPRGRNTPDYMQRIGSGGGSGSGGLYGNNSGMGMGDGSLSDGLIGRAPMGGSEAHFPGVDNKGKLRNWRVDGGLAGELGRVGSKVDMLQQFEQELAFNSAARSCLSHRDEGMSDATLSGHAGLIGPSDVYPPPLLGMHSTRPSISSTPSSLRHSVSALPPFPESSAHSSLAHSSIRSRLSGNPLADPAALSPQSLHYSGGGLVANRRISMGGSVGSGDIYGAHMMGGYELGHEADTGRVGSAGARGQLGLPLSSQPLAHAGSGVDPMMQRAMQLEHEVAMSRRSQVASSSKTSRSHHPSSILLGQQTSPVLGSVGVGGRESMLDFGDLLNTSAGQLMDPSSPFFTDRMYQSTKLGQDLMAQQAAGTSNFPGASLPEKPNFNVDVRLRQLSLKLLRMKPEELNSGTRDRIQSLLTSREFVEGSIRPGCLHLQFDFMVDVSDDYECTCSCQQSTSGDGSCCSCQCNMSDLAKWLANLQKIVGVDNALCTKKMLASYQGQLVRSEPHGEEESQQQAGQSGSTGPTQASGHGAVQPQFPQLTCVAPPTSVQPQLTGLHPRSVTCVSSADVEVLVYGYYLDVEGIEFIARAGIALPFRKQRVFDVDQNDAMNADVARQQQLNKQQTLQCAVLYLDVSAALTPFVKVQVITPRAEPSDFQVLLLAPTPVLSQEIDTLRAVFTDNNELNALLMELGIVMQYMFQKIPNLLSIMSFFLSLVTYNLLFPNQDAACTPDAAWAHTSCALESSPGDARATQVAPVVPQPAVLYIKSQVTAVLGSGLQEGLVSYMLWYMLKHNGQIKDGIDNWQGGDVAWGAGPDKTATICPGLMAAGRWWAGGSKQDATNTAMQTPRAHYEQQVDRHEQDDNEYSSYTNSEDYDDNEHDWYEEDDDAYASARSAAVDDHDENDHDDNDQQEGQDPAFQAAVGQRAVGVEMGEGLEYSDSESDDVWSGGSDDYGCSGSGVGGGVSGTSVRMGSAPSTGGASSEFVDVEQNEGGEHNEEEDDVLRCAFMQQVRIGTPHGSYSDTRNQEQAEPSPRAQTRVEQHRNQPQPDLTQAQLPQTELKPKFKLLQQVRQLRDGFYQSLFKTKDNGKTFNKPDIPMRTYSASELETVNRIGLKLMPIACLIGCVDLFWVSAWVGTQGSVGDVSTLRHKIAGHVSSAVGGQPGWSLLHLAAKSGKPEMLEAVEHYFKFCLGGIQSSDVLGPNGVTPSQIVLHAIQRKGQAQQCYSQSTQSVPSHVLGTYSPGRNGKTSAFTKPEQNDLDNEHQIRPKKSISSIVGDSAQENISFSGDGLADKAREQNSPSVVSGSLGDDKTKNNSDILSSTQTKYHSQKSSRKSGIDGDVQRSESENKYARDTKNAEGLEKRLSSHGLTKDDTIINKNYTNSLTTSKDISTEDFQAVGVVSPRPNHAQVNTNTLSNLMTSSSDVVDSSSADVRFRAVQHVKYSCNQLDLSDSVSTAAFCGTVDSVDINANATNKKAAASYLAQNKPNKSAAILTNISDKTQIGLQKHDKDGHKNGDELGKLSKSSAGREIIDFEINELDPLGGQSAKQQSTSIGDDEGDRLDFDTVFDFNDSLNVSNKCSSKQSVATKSGEDVTQQGSSIKKLRSMFARRAKSDKKLCD